MQVSRFQGATRQSARHASATASAGALLRASAGTGTVADNLTGTLRVLLSSVMIASYLTAKRDLARIAADADADALAPTLVGAAHLPFTDREAPAVPWLQ